MGPRAGLPQEPADVVSVGSHRFDGVAQFRINNQGLGLPGTQPGAEPPEWELFDCAADPLELINCYHDPQYGDAVAEMTRLLEHKMAEIGDEPMHPRRGVAAPFASH